jgi:hypothetical protein
MAEAKREELETSQYLESQSRSGATTSGTLAEAARPFKPRMAKSTAPAEWHFWPVQESPEPPIARLTDRMVDAGQCKLLALAPPDAAALLATLPADASLGSLRAAARPCCGGDIRVGGGVGHALSQLEPSTTSVMSAVPGGWWPCLMTPVVSPSSLESRGDAPGGCTKRPSTLPRRS